MKAPKNTSIVIFEKSSKLYFNDNGGVLPGFKKKRAPKLDTLGKATLFPNCCSALLKVKQLNFNAAKRDDATKKVFVVKFRPNTAIANAPVATKTKTRPAY